MYELILPESCRQSLSRAAIQRYPYEACGVFIGQVQGTNNIVEEVLQLTNVLREVGSDRYAMDPKEMYAAHERARQLGGEIVGIWHSHPDQAPRPSSLDLDAAWPEWSYLIVSVSREELKGMRSWRLSESDEKKFEEEEVLIPG